MRVFITIIVLCLLTHFTASGQNQAVVLDWSAYFKKIRSSDSLYKIKQYQASALSYADAFAFNGQRFSSGDRYNAARAWAMCGFKDSALNNLKLEVEKGYYDLSRISSEAAFESLKTEPSWKYLVNKVKDNNKKEDLKLGRYKPIKSKLEQLLILDQKYRQNYMETWKRYGDKSKEMSNLKKKMHKVDRSNLKYVTKIIDTYGWISYDTIGFDASNALFLVIQHADSTTQEKYLPILKDAVQQKRAVPESAALLEDRILTRRGEKQLYGTQVQCDDTGNKCWVMPIADEKNVDYRRKSYGMKPLADYLKQFGIEYKLPE